MKVLFLQPGNVWVDLVGVKCLSTALGRRGHECAVRIGPAGRELERALRDERPDVAAFSCVTGNHLWALRTAGLVKQIAPSVTTLIGGPHPTYFPEAVLNESVDFAIRGEAEEALVRFLDAGPGPDPQSLPNLAWAENGELKTTALLPLVEDLDSLGIPDHDLYARQYRFFAWNPVKYFFASRGCPYKCTYCFNNLFHELYRGNGRLLRRRSHEHVIEELLKVRSRYPLPVVLFEDDTFNADRGWLFEFLDKYRARVGLPFNCNVRIDLMDRETAEALARAGCRMVSFGIETGSEELRRGLLDKGGADEQILAGSAWLKEFGVRLQTTNMFGLPGETIEDGLKTITLNQRAGVDYPEAQMFLPLPRLGLTEEAIRLGVFDPADTDRIGWAIDHSLIKSPDIKPLLNAQMLLYAAVRLRLGTGLLRRLVRLPVNPVFKLIHIATHIYCIYRESEMGALRFLRFAWRHRRHQI